MQAVKSVEEKTPLNAYLFLILGGVLWGSALSIGKIALTAYDPIFLVIIRLTLAFVIFTPIVLYRFWPIRLHRRKDIFLLTLLILCDPMAFFTFEALGLQYTSASQAGMMWALGPTLNTLCAWLILREKTTLPVILCFLFAMVGVVIVTTGGEVSEHAPNPILGNAFIFLALMGAAGFMIIVRFLRGRYPPMLLVWIQCMGSSVLMLPLLGTDFVTLPTEFPLLPTIALFHLGICVTFGAQMCSAYGVSNMPIARSATIANMTPLWGVIFGLVLLGETMLPLQWVACVLVLLAVITAQYFHLRNLRRLRR